MNKTDPTAEHKRLAASASNVLSPPRRFDFPTSRLRSAQPALFLSSARGPMPLLLLLPVLTLLALGIVILYSTSGVTAQEIYGDGSYFLKRQLVFLGLGFFACSVVATLDYRIWSRHTKFLLGGAVVLLLLCLTPHMGLKINGARRWLGTHGIRFQPSDFAKFTLIIFLAAWLDRHQDQIKSFSKGFLIPMAATGIVTLLIFVEPDFGTTALTAAVALTMLFVAGTRVRFLIPTLLLGVSGFVFAVMHNPVRWQRIMAFADPVGTAQGAGYQTWQSLLAFGSGGLFGRGLGNSGAKFFYLPEARTDFILAIVGEELGLLGALVVVVAFAVLLFSGLRIALRARELFGSLLALGITSLLGFQALINIGVVTGSLPNKGLPLPFISYGGSNLVMNLISLGVLISVARHSEPIRDRAEEEEFSIPSSSKKLRCLA